MKKIYNKLVRDKIPEIIAKSGKTVKFKSLSKEEYQQSLKYKLIEEVNELLAAETKDNIIEELADIEEVVFAIKKEYQVNSDVWKIKTLKKTSKGSFDKRYFLESVEE